MREEFFFTGLVDLCEEMRKESGGSLKDKTMIEIGTYAGDSTFVFSRYFGKVYTIDPFEESHFEMDAPLKKYAPMKLIENFFKRKLSDRDNVEHLKMTSDDAVHLFENESVDFVYIDGLHTYEQITTDIKNYYPFVKKMGYIGGHDYTKEWNDTFKAVNNKFKDQWIGIFQDTSWLVKKVEIKKVKTVI